MKGIWFTDVHLSETPPARRTDTYLDDIVAKITEVAGIAVKINADIAIFGGDWFHLRSGIRTSHALVNLSLKLLDMFPCPILMLPGNHDIPYNRLDLLDKRPFGTLLQHHNVINLLSDVVMFEQAKVKIIPVPGVADLSTQAIQTIMGANYQVGYVNIAVVHQPIVRKGDYPFVTIKIADLVGYADVLLYGHIHQCHGTELLTVNGKSTWVSNVGAIARGVLSYDELVRSPQCLVFGINNGEFKSKDIILTSAKPAQVIFRLGEKHKEEQREIDISQFLQSISETTFGLFTKEAAIDKIRGMDSVSDDVKNKAIELLTNA